MELKIPERQLICIDYPCVINNISKALGTLGGERTVTRTYLEPARRLELRFRPDDIYCKPACADRREFCGLLIKIRRRRLAQHKEDSQAMEFEGTSLQSTSEIDIKGEVVGVVDTMYHFNSMMDFQFLPMMKTKDDCYQSLVQELVINKLESRSWLDESVRLYIPPPTFTRYGRPIQYCYREPANPRDGIPNCSQSSSIIGIARQRRPRFTAFFRFSQVTVPEAPFPQAIDKLLQHQALTKRAKEVKELFEHRPIWTRSALCSRLPHLSKEDLQFILPTVSYYCHDGPWHAMWVRFGYDMRKDPSSKIYQNLDFRLRRTLLDLNSIIPAKRSIFDFNLPNTVTKSCSQTSIIQKKAFLDVNPEELKNLPNPKEEQLKEGAYKFRVGMIPPSRQMFYHLCDVEEAEVQRLVHSNDGLETECTERDGWCMPETVDKCRAILLEHIEKALTRKTSEVSANDGDIFPDNPPPYQAESHFESDQGGFELEAVQHILQTMDYNASSSDNEGEGEEDEDDEELEDSNDKAVNESGN